MTRFILVPVLGIAALAATVPARAQTTAAGWLGRSQVAYADSDRRSYYDARREAYDNGYREGLKEGQKDGRKNEQFRYQDEKTFQRADKGYHREFGDIQRYRQSFRSGYADGYSEAYQRYGSAYGAPGRYEDSRGRYEGPRGRVDESRGRYGRGGRNGVGRGPGRDADDDPAYYPQDPRYRGTLPDYRSGDRGRYGSYQDLAFENGAEDGFEKGLEDVRKGRSFDPLRHAWYRAADRRYEGRAGSREEYRDTYRRGFQQGYERGYREGRYR